MIEIKLSGFKEIDEALKNFPDRVQKNILAGAVRAGIKPVVDAMKAGAPVATKPHYFYPNVRKGIRKTLVGGRFRRGDRMRDRILIQPGLIQRSIRAWRSRSNEATVVYHAGPRKGKGSYEVDPWYANFFEYGTPKIAAKSFIRDASDKTQDKQIEAMKEYLWKRIFKEFAKLAGG